MLVHSQDVKVMNQDVLACEIAEDMMQRPEFFTPLEIEQIYNELSRYTLADVETTQAQIGGMRCRDS